MADELTAAGLAAETLPGGAGLIAHVIGDPSGPVVALRADLDALPLSDEKEVPYRSTVSGVAHACGHDVHTTALIGAALALRSVAGAGDLPGVVRLLFQPAEEVLPGGALSLLASGALDDVVQVFALHCDPRLDVGRVAVRPGPITAAADYVRGSRLTGPGGHTARLPPDRRRGRGALADVLARTPALLSRRTDPLASASLVWGRVQAGGPSNVIPDSAEAAGTVRVFDPGTWEALRALVPDLVREVAAPFGAGVEVDYEVGVPPAVNDEVATGILRQAVASGLGADAVAAAGRSMGGEDFAWMLERVPGALGRLGVRRPGATDSVDLHRGRFDVDERAIGYGATVLAAAAVAALEAVVAV